ncbi:MAG: C-GCAxxG-C-C family (seleno)protein [Clostridiales bacterium]|nr:C-GCAxxG-C-C family (seleno)protein [Clostridiales bacterium]MDY5513837.1 C-GCAxxG-C-C family (seleno)protein [Candidatus Ventricola sp.]
MLQSRREFLKKSVALLGGSALLSGAPLASVLAESQPEAPAHPFPYAELDLDKVEQLAYEGYFENGCCYGVAKGLLAELCDKVGFPYTMIPPEMFANGKEGYTAGSLCGALGGAAGIIGLCCAPDDARAITKELFAWYTSTPLPIYQPEGAAPVQTVSSTVNCVDSVSEFMTEANVERADPIRKRRCGGVSGDVARKTAELLNIHYGFMEAPAAAAPETELAANEYIGEAEGFGGPVKVKVTMDGDKIDKIDVLSHSDTPGICDAAYNTIPQAIIDAQSTQVDVSAGATFSSKGIMAAVEDALSKVGK